MSEQSKDQLRSLLRQRRRCIPKDDQIQAAQAVAELALSLPHWENAQKVALYMANDGEVDNAAIAQQAFATNIEIFLPVVENNKKMVFVHWHRNEVLLENRYGIPEPAPKTSPEPLSSIDIIFMPLVAFDREGNRLGMGGGYYDRALADGPRPTLIGLAHSLQEVSSLRQEPWDIGLDIVITEQGVHYCHPAAAR